MITVAIIDDDNDTVGVFAECLEYLGVKVVSVGYDGKQAVEIYKKHRPDVLFLDLMMPTYDGIYGLKEIRAIDPQAKVIIVCADLTAKNEEDLDKLKPTKIVFKPFDVKKLKVMLDELTNNPVVNLVDNAKKTLVSFTIMETLLQIGRSTSNEVGSRLYAKYNCYFSDCLEHPEYLKDVLQEIFGNGSNAIIKTIREKLAAYENQQPISNFLIIMSK